MTGAQLRTARERLGLTQEELAAKLGKHRVTIGEWEADRAEVPAWAPLALLGLEVLERRAAAARRRRPSPNGRAHQGSPRGRTRGTVREST
jgi:transcriptional regulator with XRE-family HTH domain